jgi:branched-chain amino acid transport system substrate-binding protein
MTFTRRQFATTLAAGLTFPAIIKQARAEDTIKIGMVVPITGPAAESGKFAQIGARLALERINKAGGVLGKQLELVTEDDQTTNSGAVLAFSKLSSQPDIVAFLGSVRSTQVHAMAPDLAKVERPMMVGGTDPTLTHQGAKWLFRCRPNDSYSGRVIAAYGIETLAKKKWAVVHSTDAFGTAGSKALISAVGESGATVVLDQGYPNQSQDFSSVVLAVRQSGAEILGSYFTFETDLGIFARQLRQLGVTVPWIGSPSITNASALKLAGPALYGTYGVADYTEGASNEAAEFGKLFRAASGNIIPDNQSSWTFDAVGLLGIAIKAAGSTEPAKLRQALIAIKGYKGAEGEYNFDENGDGLRGYNVVRNDKGAIVFDKHVEFKA